MAPEFPRFCSLLHFVVVIGGGGYGDVDVLDARIYLYELPKENIGNIFSIAFLCPKIFLFCYQK